MAFTACSPGRSDRGALSIYALLVIVRCPGHSNARGHHTHRAENFLASPVPCATAQHLIADGFEATPPSIAPSGKDAHGGTPARPQHASVVWAHLGRGGGRSHHHLAHRATVLSTQQERIVPQKRQCSLASLESDCATTSAARLTTCRSALCSRLARAGLLVQPTRQRGLDTLPLSDYSEHQNVRCRVVTSSRID